MQHASARHPSSVPAARQQGRWRNRCKARSPCHAATWRPAMGSGLTPCRQRQCKCKRSCSPHTRSGLILRRPLQCQFAPSAAQSAAPCHHCWYKHVNTRCFWRLCVETRPPHATQAFFIAPHIHITRTRKRASPHTNLCCNNTHTQPHHSTPHRRPRSKGAHHASQAHEPARAHGRMVARLLGARDAC